VPEPVFEERIATTRSRRQELTTAGALKLARSYRPPYMPTTILTLMHDQHDPRDRFDIVDAAELPWPDGSVDLIVTSLPYGLSQACAQGGDVPDYATWLTTLATWLAELFRVAHSCGGGCA